MWVTNPASYTSGDIGFYTSKGGVLDTAISLRTGSPIVHVAIFKQAGLTIAATSGGITQQRSGNEYAVWRPNGGYLVGRYAEAAQWLAGEVGKPYGYADIANQLLLLTGQDPVLLDKSEDCSDLAAKFLWIAGVPLPGTFINTNRITPGGLYAALDAIL